MINRVMKPGAAAIALAVSALIALPAAADHSRDRGHTSHRSDSGSSFSIRIGTGNTGYNTYGNRSSYGNSYGYRPYSASTYAYRTGSSSYGHGPRSDYQNRAQKRMAVGSCQRAIARRAWKAGFRDVDYDNSARIRQIGPAGYRIHFRDVELESRRREVERDITCVVRKGQVVSLDGQNRGRGHSSHGYSGHNGYSVNSGYRYRR